MQVQQVRAPAIVAPSHVIAHTNQHATLAWIRSGMATVEAAGVRHRVSGGEALWVPAGVRHELWLEQGTVIEPVAAPLTDLPEGLAQVRMVMVPAEWEDWLTSGCAYSSPAALFLLVRGGPPPGVAGATLLMPTSPEALAVAHALLRDPGTMLGAEILAKHQLVSERTLRRQFARETGLVFADWRSRARIAVAAQQLTQGTPIARVGLNVGFASPAAFSRAFRRHTGLAPREYARRTAFSTAAETAATEKATAATVALLATVEAPPKPPSLPARQEPMRVNDCHVLLWMHRGRGSIRIGIRVVGLTMGKLVWVPAGVAHQVDLDAGSIVLPLGNRYGRSDISVDELIVFECPPEDELFLLYTSASEYTLVRPESGRGRFIDELFRAQFSAGRNNEPSLKGAAGAIAVALWRDPADVRSLADWATHLHTTPDDLGRAFLDQTGQTFPRWRGHLRMSVARVLLESGKTPGEIARRLGYANVSTFGRVFTTAHGASPRAYQRQLLGR